MNFRIVTEDRGLVVLAMSEALAGNNGWAYADFLPRRLFSAVEAEGYTVTTTGGRVKVYTARAVAALKRESPGVARSTYVVPASFLAIDADFEAAILARQSAAY